MAPRWRAGHVEPLTRRNHRTEHSRPSAGESGSPAYQSRPPPPSWSQPMPHGTPRSRRSDGFSPASNHQRRYLQVVPCGRRRVPSRPSPHPRSLTRRSNDATARLRSCPDSRIPVIRSPAPAHASNFRRCGALQSPTRPRAATKGLLRRCRSRARVAVRYEVLGISSPAHPVSLAEPTTPQPGPGPAPGHGPGSRIPTIRSPADASNFRRCGVLSR